MWQWIKDEAKLFWNTFHSSEVIIWARAQYILLAVFEALQMVDVSAFISDHRMLQCYIFANGVISELLRRRNAEYNSDGSMR